MTGSANKLFLMVTKRKSLITVRLTMQSTCLDQKILVPSYALKRSTKSSTGTIAIRVDLQETRERAQSASGSATRDTM